MTGSVPNAPRIPTVRDVAALAGVSPMTVSRTMSGGQNVSAEVRTRVHAAADQLGYRPNQNARNTRLRQPTGLIGVAVTNLGNPYYGQFALGIEDEAARHNRHILIGNSREDPLREAELLDGFTGRQVEGLIVVPAGNGLGFADRLGSLPRVPLVLATRSIEGLEKDTVLVDDVGGAHAGTASLIGEGHRRIAFLGDVDGIPTARRRFQGFTEALAAAGIPFDRALLAPVRDTAAASVAVQQLLGQPDPPTAFFSVNNRTTVGALRALSGHRSTTGGRASALASFDDVELADLLGIPLTVMSHDPRALGAQAASLLFDRLAEDRLPEHGPARPRLVQMPVTVRRYPSPPKG
ncbi:LacI family DNA-binding transcriptional regulator [Arthrobacter sp. 260]|uniref:LacI family DNA-binding transcriptional regulator n=1 Tax=Arthrobacter sp. 260 TaxID=2735314 RepID=UPI0014925781|nr:LacI family DNA-binding transcriptional regulator [Arthrobacter sp. 260]NOJ58907.1 LacI family DNA-binding transcriptional regulator [Arthrobacter sp. 260]